jgi:hypothetical protein
MQHYSVIGRVRALVVALLLVASLASPMVQAQSPMSQAIDARAVLNNDVLSWIAIANKRLADQYAESVRQWVANKQQVKAGTALPPIPVPPASWVAIPHAYTPSERFYDAGYPGIAPRIDDVQSGPPVAPQYVEPTAPVAPIQGTVVHVGSYLRDGEYACMPDDTMPAGFVTRAADGTWVKKVLLATPWGTAAIYSSKVN